MLQRTEENHMKHTEYIAKRHKAAKEGKCCKSGGRELKEESSVFVSEKGKLLSVRYVR
jgi:hypothetical protein